jgi:hypothetical protein
VSLFGSHQYDPHSRDDVQVFCGILSRIQQYADAVRESKRQIQLGFYHQAILGDLNTMAHGIARLSPSYCCDQVRCRNLLHIPRLRLSSTQ